jgi:RNA polymerase sigma factor (sigma-70 family)
MRSEMKPDLLTNDPDLLGRFREGERDAMVAVWNFYYPAVVSLARRGFEGTPGFRHQADVEDAVSATFLAALQERARLSYDGITPYGAYLLGVGKNVMRRLARKAYREPVWEIDDDSKLCASEATPEQHVLRREKREVLERFETCLEPPQLDVFSGYYKRGLSEEKLAAELGKTRHSVRKTLHKVQRMMRRYLAKNDIL